MRACLVDILHSATADCGNLILKLSNLVPKSKLGHLQRLRVCLLALDITRLALLADVNIICPEYQKPGFATWRTLREKGGTVVCAVKSKHLELMHKLDALMLFIM